MIPEAVKSWLVIFGWVLGGIGGFVLLAAFLVGPCVYLVEHHHPILAIIWLPVAIAAATATFEVLDEA